MEGDHTRTGRTTLGNAFFFSLNLHLFLLALLLIHHVTMPKTPPLPEEETLSTSSSTKVFLPPTEVLRQLAAAPRRANPPRPVEPPKEAPKDRISIGSPHHDRAKDRLVLRREDDLTAVPKGRPNAEGGTPTPAAPDAAPVDGGEARPSSLPLAAGRGSIASGAEEAGGRRGPSITSSLRNLDHLLKQSGDRGVATGTGQQMGPLFFDPEGADFTAWINQFKNEVYRNWIVPQPALLGFRGHVDIQFVVARDGSLSGLRILKSSGMAALDRAAQNSLVASRFLPLPSDYGPDLITMQVGFYYNEGPQRS